MEMQGMGWYGKAIQGMESKGNARNVKTWHGKEMKGIA
jgi:hypothetical protein